MEEPCVLHKSNFFSTSHGSRHTVSKNQELFCALMSKAGGVVRRTGSWTQNTTG
jgi:hypothetical protein